MWDSSLGLVWLKARDRLCDMRETNIAWILASWLAHEHVRLDTRCNNKGAANSGIDSIWVTDNGIHKDDVQSQGAESVCRNFNQNEFTYAYGRRIGATYLTSRFKW